MEPSDKEARLEWLWEQLLNLKPTNEQLLSVISQVKPLEKAAIKQLWRQGATKEDLVFIMSLDPSLLQAIQKLLDVRNRRDKIIQQILEEMKSLTDKDN